MYLGKIVEMAPHRRSSRRRSIHTRALLSAIPYDPDALEESIVLDPSEFNRDAC
jgi:ABC-type oligopeptide transport system ATPase subunit